MSNSSSNSTSATTIASISALITKIGTITLTSPFDRIKILLMVQHIHPNIKPEQRYTSTFDLIKRVVREQGVLSFWRGNQIAILRGFQSLYINQMLKENPLLYKLRPTNSSYSSNLAYNITFGAFAGFLSLMLCYPLDVARNKIGADVNAQKQRQYRGLFDCWGKIWKNDGVVGLYRGFTLSMAGIVLYRGLYLGLYDTFKGFTANSSFMAKFMLGYAVTLTSGFVSYPLSVMTRRLMIQSGEEPKLFKTGLQALKYTWQTEGFRGMYRGYAFTLGYSIGNSMVLVLYDQATRNK